MFAELPRSSDAGSRVDVPLGTAANEMRHVIEMLINGVADQATAATLCGTNDRANRDRIHLLAL